MNPVPNETTTTPLVRNLLLISNQPAFAGQFQTAAAGLAGRIIHRATVAEAEPLLHPALVDGCVLHATGAGVETIWAIDQIRQRSPTLPLILFTESADWNWAEEAFVRGVQHILPGPPRPRLLASILGRLAPAAPAAAETGGPASPPAPAAATGSSAAAEAPLEVMRQFSTILKHSLSASSLLSQFLLLLREVTGINRATVFLRHTEPADATSGRVAATDFRAACAIGLPAQLSSEIRLSTAGGIGAFLLRHGRVLRCQSPEAQADPHIRREFELLGAQVAVPVLDRESLLGIATFDGRVTGEPLSGAELNLIFQLLEEIGLALRNIRLHDELAANHETLANVLRQLNQACVVVGRDLRLLHANRAAQRQLLSGARGEPAFADLPSFLGGKVYQVLQTGAGLEPFEYRTEGAGETLLRVTLLPLRGSAGQVEAALLLAEDKTLERQLAQLQTESAQHKFLKTMADRMAHEIGNALVPVSTYLQLLHKPPKGQDFLASLEGALSDSVTRITRLVNQMRFLARDSLPEEKEFPLAPLIKDAWQEAQRHQPGDHPKLECEAPDKPVLVVGDPNALKHALAETMLNALQSGPRNGTVGVKLAPTVKNDGAWVDIEIEDAGQGFKPEEARSLPKPFETTRTVGLGLGLTVSRRIIESHRGKLELLPADANGHGRVRISLPLAQVPASN
jgi:signal transduction histidine kinase/CheY-like chemotaxis protein